MWRDGVRTDVWSPSGRTRLRVPLYTDQRIPLFRRDSPLHVLWLNPERTPPSITTMTPISFSLNGVQQNITVDDTRNLLWVLRDDLGFTGTKFGCGESFCGACTVLMNDEAIHACTTPMRAVNGKRIVTIEGLAHDDRLSPVQAAFVKHLGFQCGYCTSGMIMGAHALLIKNASPTRAEIVKGMEQHLCRCGAQVRIVDAIESASAAVVGGTK